MSKGPGEATAVVTAIGGDSLMVITFVPWNPETDMAEVRHDGMVAWQDSLGHVDQYFLHSMPRGVPVILEVAEE